MNDLYRSSRLYPKPVYQWLFPRSSEKNVNYQESTEQWGWMMDRSCREEHTVRPRASSLVSGFPLPCALYLASPRAQVGQVLRVPQPAVSAIGSNPRLPPAHGTFLRGRPEPAEPTECPGHLPCCGSAGLSAWITSRRNTTNVGQQLWRNSVQRTDAPRKDTEFEKRTLHTYFSFLITLSPGRQEERDRMQGLFFLVEVSLGPRT